MKQPINTTSRERGILTLMIIFTLGVFSLGAVLVLASNTVHDITGDRLTRSGTKTFNTAESTALEGVYRYISSSSGAEYTGNESLSLNDTTGDIVIEKNWPSNWPYLTIHGKGSDDTTNRDVSRRITVFAEGLAFEHAIYSNFTFSATGNTEINGNIFANDAINLGGSTDIYGNVYSPVGVTGEDHATGTVATTSVVTIPPPEIAEGDYREAAVSAGTLYATDSAAELFLKNETREAVVFIDDTASEANIQGTTLVGSLYGKGDLKLSSGGTYTATGTYAAIVCEGNLQISGGVTINGLVYVRGSTSFGSGNNTINGALISVGPVSSIETTGNTTINYVPMDWQDLSGLSTTTSSQPPRMLEWGEE